jgi:acyl-CoA carboxylase subunit beta
VVRPSRLPTRRTEASQTRDAPTTDVLPCPACAAPLDGLLHQEFAVCDHCGHHLRRTARETIAALVDPGTFNEMDSRLSSRDPLQFVDDIPYDERLRETRRKTGETDAIVTGTARIGGCDIVLAVLDFGFLGGSMGVVVGEKLVRAAGRATRSRCPLVTVVASGGARMQEGLLSLMQMAKTAAAIKRLHDRGVPYISVLTNPTTGGVFASFANLGDITIAEPGALIGFAGPRVVEQVIGRKLEEGTHTAEFLLDHGMIDAIVSRPDLRETLAGLLDMLGAQRLKFPREDAPETMPAASAAAPAWEVVQGARDRFRPTSLDYVERLTERFFALRGDRVSGDDPAVVAGLGMLSGNPIAIVALERGHDLERETHHGGMARPEGYRKAQRVMRLAARLRLPVLSLVDTPGAYPGPESEEGGLAGELAGCMALMSDLPTPTVAAVIGEGGSGGALALAVADRVLMQQGAIYSVIAPEGAATILFRSAQRAPELSERLKITADELVGLGLVDAVVPEPDGGAAADPDGAAMLLGAAIVRAFADLQQLSIDKLVQQRWDRYQAIGRDHAGNLRRLDIGVGVKRIASAGPSIARRVRAARSGPPPLPAQGE